MARLTGRELHYLEQIADLVQFMCGDNFEHVRCSCLDEDDEAEHDPLCAWDTVSPVLEALKEAVDHTPAAAKVWVERARKLIRQSDQALHQKALEQRREEALKDEEGS